MQKSNQRALAFQIIREFGAMKDGWDGYGALQIKEITCRNCEQFLNTLPDTYPSPELTPNSNGTISMEWESQHGRAFLEIGKTRYSFYIKLLNSNPVLRDGNAQEIKGDIVHRLAALSFP